jgi:predicted RNase H-like nuclease (RuvC/YqgF family)
MSDVVRWLSYDEIAAALDISRESARQLAIRKRWARQRGNDGKARVGVPDEELQARTSHDTPPDTPSDTSDEGSVVQVLTRYVERLENELDAIRAKLEAVETERDTERARAAQVEVLQAVLEVERKRFEGLHQDRDALRQERDKILDRLMTPEPRTGFFDRLRKVFA